MPATRHLIKIVVKNNKKADLGTRNTFADIGCSIADNFNIEKPSIGKSFLNEI